MTISNKFPVTSFEQWEAEALKSLRGRLLSDLTNETAEGIQIKPLYTRPQGLCDTAGLFPYTRSLETENQSRMPEGVRLQQHYTHPSTAVCNELILDELNQGVTGIQLDYLSRQNNDYARSQPATLQGILINNQADLARTLKGVRLELVPVSLSAGLNFQSAAQQLESVWNTQGLPKEQCKGAFNADPVATYTQTGSSDALSESTFESLGLFASHTSKHYPSVTSVAIDASLYHNAGATTSQELGFMLASARLYLQTLLNSGLTIDDACHQIECHVAVNTDYFLSAAKLRAARTLWARLSAECGGSGEACKVKLVARTSSRMLTQRDPWTNILRTTVAASAAVLGGAPTLSIGSFDALRGATSTLGRRIARNIATIVQEESGLHRVVDPLGGSGYIEDLTEKLCEQAWLEFQTIEKNNGIVASLQDLSLHKAIDESHHKELDLVRHRHKSIVGISEFAANEEVIPPSDPAFLEQAKAILETNHCDQSVNSGENAITLTVRHLSAEFEELREAAENHTGITNTKPSVLTIAFGRPAEYLPRVQFCHNILSAGGIETADPNNTFNDTASVTDNIDASVSAHKTSLTNNTASTVLVCTGPSTNHENCLLLVTRLAKEGARCILYAGKPEDDTVESAYKNAGVNFFLYKNCDAIEALRNVHDAIGIKR